MVPVSLKARMSFTVMTLVLLVLAGVGSLALWHYKLSLRQLIADHQGTLVRQVADRIDRQLEDASRLIAATAADFPVERLETADLAQDYLDTRLGLGTTRLFDNGIFLFDARGVLVAEHPFKPDRRGRDYSFRRYFQQTVASDRPQISDPYISSQEHRHPAVNFTAPIHDRRGRIAGVIAGSVDLTRDNFLGGLSDIRVGRTGYLYLYSSERRMIMHPDQNRIMQQDVPVGANAAYDRALAGFEGTMETVNSRGLHSLATFKRLNEGRWILAANYPVAEAFAPVSAALRYLLLGLTVILLLTCLVTWGTTRTLLAPLARLERHVASFFQASPERMPHSGDEITTLSLTFDQLMSEVAEQRRTAEDRLAFLQGIMDSFPHPSFYQDLDGRLQGANRAMQALCGLPLGHLIGTRLHNHLDAASAGKIATGDEQLLRRDEALHRQELCLADPNGASLYFMMYKSLLRDGQGSPQGIVSTLIDVSALKQVELALAREREFSLRLLEYSATPSFVIDADHKVLIWTRALEELTGLVSGEVIGTDEHWRGFYSQKRPCLADIVLDNDLETAIETYHVLADSPLIQTGLQAEGWLTLNNGRVRYLSFEAAPIYDGDRLVAVIETLHDLTNLKEVEKSLRETQQSYHALVDSSPDAILVHRQEVVLYANRAARELFRATAETDLAGRSVATLFHPDSQAHAFEQMAEVELLKQENRYVEEKIVCCDGQALQVEVGLSPTYYRGDWAVQMVLRDITARLAEQERIWRQANFDTLTGLPNRSLFRDRLTQTLVRCDRERQLAGLLFVDLDHFKQVNDSLGHDNGDELLRQAARRMNGCLRQTDTLARLGGDEFTVIIPALENTEELQLVARRLIESLTPPFMLPGGTGRISCSIGAAVYPRDAQGIDDLLCIADAAMYRIKQSGRNGCCIAGLEALSPPDLRPLSVNRGAH